MRPPRAVAPFREVNDIGPVRAFCLPVARRCAPRWASRLTLDAPPECFESASTTDVSLTSTRRENTLSGDSCRAPWEIPPAFCFEILPDGASPPSFERTLDHLTVIQPPAAPCLTARGRLRVEEPPRRALARGVHARQLFRLRVASLLGPSDALSATGVKARERSFSCRRSRFPGPLVKVGPLPRDQGAFHRESPCQAPFGLARRLAPAGRRAL